MNMSTTPVSFNGMHYKHFSNGESNSTIFTNDMKILERLQNKVKYGYISGVESYTKKDGDIKTGDKLEFDLNGNVHVTANKDIVENSDRFSHTLIISAKDKAGTAHQLDITDVFSSDETINKKLAAVTSFLFDKINNMKEEETSKNNQEALDILG